MGTAEDKGARVSMNAAKLIATYQRLREQPLWRLLAAHHGPIIVGILQTHLDETVRSVPASILPPDRSARRPSPGPQSVLRQLERPPTAQISSTPELVLETAAGAISTLDA